MTKLWSKIDVNTPPYELFKRFIQAPRGRINVMSDVFFFTGFSCLDMQLVPALVCG